MPVFAVSGCQTEIPVKGVLRAEVNTAVLEIGGEFLLHFPVLRVELLNVVFRYVERSDLPLGLYDRHLVFLFDGYVQQTAAYEVHQLVQVHSLIIFRE